MVLKPKKKILLVGVGGFGKNHLRDWSVLGQELYVADLDLKRLTTCDTYNIPEERRSTNYKEFLSVVDAVDIVTPTVTHYPISMESLAAGKDIFVEKPITYSSDQAKSLAEEAEKRQAIVQVGHVFRFNPVSQEIKSLLNQGRVGEIKYLSGHFTEFKGSRSDVGATPTLGIHHIDLFNFFVGDLPKEVYAVMQDPVGRGVEDLSIVHLHYVNGVFAQIESGNIQPGRIRDITLVGTKANIQADLEGRKLELNNQYHTFLEGVLKAEDKGGERPYIQSREPLLTELQDFLFNIQERKQPEANARVGFNLSRIIEACYESSKCGQRVEPNYL